MQTKRKRETRKYPQSAGNLALADESRGLTSKIQSRDPLPCAGRGTGHYGKASEADALAPATGIIVGIGLSIMLWCLIILVMYWNRLTI